MEIAFLVLLLASTANVASAQTNRIDIVRPDAPELAAFGAHDIGVGTLVPAQVDTALCGTDGVKIAGTFEDRLDLSAPDRGSSPLQIGWDVEHCFSPSNSRAH